MDVRRFPGSRRHPQFSRAALEPALAAEDIGYTWMEALGGRRAAAPDSTNTGWRNAAFRGYADYMASGEFADAFAELLRLAEGRRAAIMCSESLWWRCHRRLLSDLLTARGWDVLHIEPRGGTAPHRLMAPARLDDGRLTYAKG